MGRRKLTAEAKAVARAEKILGINGHLVATDFGSGRHGYTGYIDKGASGGGSFEVRLVLKADQTYSLTIEPASTTRTRLAEAGWPITERKQPERKQRQTAGPRLRITG